VPLNDRREGVWLGRRRRTNGGVDGVEVEVEVEGLVGVGFHERRLVRDLGKHPCARQAPPQRGHRQCDPQGVNGGPGSAHFQLKRSQRKRWKPTCEPGDLRATHFGGQPTFVIFDGFAMASSR
jgi:hypothetical protein